MQRYLRAATPSEDGDLREHREHTPDLGGSVRVLERGDNTDEFVDGPFAVESDDAASQFTAMPSAGADVVPDRAAADGQPWAGSGLPQSISGHGARSKRRPSTERIAATVVADLVAQLAAIVVVAAIAYLTQPVISLHTFSLLAIGVVIGWIVVLGATGGYLNAALRNRRAELRHVFRSSIYVGVIACIAFNSFASGISQVTVLGTMILVLVTTIGARLLLRRAISRAAGSEAYATRVVLVGSLATVVDTATRMAEASDSDVRVVGLCVATPEHDDRLDTRLIEVPLSLPIVSDADLVGTVADNDADVVIVTSPSALGSARVRQIAWQLETTGAELMLSTGLEHVADHRIGTQRIGAERLVTVEQPRYNGVRRVVADVAGRIAAAAGLIALSPILLTVALVVRIDSKGPAFFIQRRVGRNGKTFRMVKFRSMVQDAEKRLDDVVSSDNEPDRGPMFKSRNDPRITRVGRILRKSSVDELPQLINVVCGSMSLVGPRPALPKEVAEYQGFETRRLLVKPGITGLWQVSGRSNLDWEQTVNLDLHYVENWSPVADLSILSRTVGAVVHSSGAY